MKKIFFIILLAVFPVILNAKTFKGFVDGLNDMFVPSLFSLFIVMAVAFFALNVFMFVIAEGDKKQKAKDRLGWSVIALVVLMSVWGIVSILQNTAPSLNKGQESFDFKSNYQYNNIYKSKY